MNWFEYEWIIIMGKYHMVMPIHCGSIQGTISDQQKQRIIRWNYYKHYNNLIITSSPYQPPPEPKPVPTYGPQ